jgi:hypothetical protein
MRVSTTRTGLLIGVLALAAYSLVLRPKHLRWGASDAETKELLPGDELVPDSSFVATHAITIYAPPELVLPWFLQLGQDRAGFYSYTALENLFGCRMVNTLELRPEWSLQAGDSVLFHPMAPRVPVALIEEGVYVCLGMAGVSSWTFFCKRIGPTKTRLIIRLRSNPKSLAGKVFHLGFWEPAHFVMEQKMMRTIKTLAERAFTTQSGTPA